MADELAAYRAEAQARYHVDKGSAEAAREAERELMTDSWSVRTCAEDVLSNADREPGVPDRTAHLNAAYEALNAIVKILENIKNNPSNERYRRLRTTNERLQRDILRFPGTLELLHEAGFVADGPEYVAMPTTVADGFIAASILHITRASKHHKKSKREAASIDPERERIMRQIELDKQDRARCQRTVGPSVGRTLQFGANIKTSKECNIEGKGG